MDQVLWLEKHGDALRAIVPVMERLRLVADAARLFVVAEEEQAGFGADYAFPEAEYVALRKALVALVG